MKIGEAIGNCIGIVAATALIAIAIVVFGSLALLTLGSACESHSKCWVDAGHECGRPTNCWVDNAMIYTADAIRIALKGNGEGK